MSPSEKTDARDPSGGAGRPPSTGASGGGASGGGPSTAAGGTAARPAASRPAARPTTTAAPAASGPGTLGNGPRPAAAGPAQRGTTAGRPLASPPAAARTSAAAPAAAATTSTATSTATAPTSVRPARTAEPARSGEQPEVAHAAPSAAGEAPRRVKLSLSRVSLWSVARLAFLLSVALGIIAVVAVTVLWAVLNGMGVFSQLDSVISDVVGSESDFRVADLLSLSRVLSVTVFLAVVDVVLLTLISTIAAVLYNLASGLVGGVRLTLSDD